MPSESNNKPKPTQTQRFIQGFVAASAVLLAGFWVFAQLTNNTDALSGLPVSLVALVALYIVSRAPNQNKTEQAE